MKTINIPHTQRELNKFAAEQWEKTLAFLQGHFSLSRTDCEDVFQESFIILYQNIIDGKLDNITSSLSTYFNAICRNKAYELLRSSGKELNIIDFGCGKSYLTFVLYYYSTQIKNIDVK